MSWQSYRQAVDVLRQVDGAAEQARVRAQRRLDEAITVVPTDEQLGEDETWWRTRLGQALERAERFGGPLSADPEADQPAAPDQPARGDEWSQFTRRAEQAVRRLDRAVADLTARPDPDRPAPDTPAAPAG